MANIKGHHKCPVCGTQTTFTITDLDYQICDECKEPVSIGAPVKQLRTQLLKEQQVTRLVEEGMSTFDHKGVLHSNSINDFEDLYIICMNLVTMTKECISILEDNRLMVGDNKAETDEYLREVLDKLNKIKLKYKKV